MIRPLPAFLLSSLIALGGAAVFVLLAGGATFHVGLTRLPLIYVLTPLLGLALFQLAFGLTARRWRGSVFWLLALPISGTLWGTGLYLVLQDQLSPLTVAVAEAVTHVAAGLVALRLTEAA